MELQQILNQLEGSTGDTEKIASVADPAEARLQEALGEVLNETTEKTAQHRSTQTPVEGLMKQAEMISGAEKQAEIEHAKMLGMAFADSAIQKWAAYDAMIKKEASMNTGEAELDYAIKTAAAQGYADTSSILDSYQEKTAEEEYAEGQQAALEELQKVAAGEFMKGAAETNILIQRRLQR